MNRTPPSPAALARALSLRDLTDPRQGPHAMQLLVEVLHQALAAQWGCARQLHRASPIVPVGASYGRLGYPADAAARQARYSRYVAEGLLLRTQTSAMIPDLLQSLALDPPADLLLICPGLTFRRERIDRLHTSEPHQLDLWRLSRRPLGPVELGEMVQTALRAALPGQRYRLIPASRPSTRQGMQIDVQVNGEWIEVGECGLAAPAVLAANGLDPAQVSGLAMRLGLDRLLMLRKGIPDIRLLRDPDPRVQAQMQDLASYRPVSDRPPARRELAVAVAADVDARILGDRVREALGERAGELEALELIEETPDATLPASALGHMGPGRKNVLLRLTIRHPSRMLSAAEADDLGDQVYALVHEGAETEWAGPERAYA